MWEGHNDFTGKTICNYLDLNKLTDFPLYSAFISNYFPNLIGVTTIYPLFNYYSTLKCFLSNLS